MSAGREKDQKDFDLEQIVKIIDQALESDDQRIKDALRALMTITVLCTAEHPDQVMKNGPLERVFEDMRHLGRRLSDLEDDVQKIKWDQSKPGGGAGQPAMPYALPTNWPDVWHGINPLDTKPTWGPSYTSACDDPNYQGASAGITGSAEEFIKSLEGKY